MRRIAFGRFMPPSRLACAAIAVAISSVASLASMVAFAESPASPAAVKAPGYVATYSDDGAGNLTLIRIEGSPLASSAALRTHTYPQFVAEHAPIGPATITELHAADRATLDAALRERGLPLAVPARAATRGDDDELVTIVANGPANARIDLVFMGDGYTESERAKFFADVQRMTRDLFEGKTFASYLPLFNVYAVFRPSKESGIGKNDRAKDTAYGLYREGETLRAIYPSNLGAIRESCSVAPGCDYPIVIANDPHYGGLGGEVAISTSSESSGTIVLRHELGHNFGRVGEEYDGGGYFGANHSSSLARLTWSHWLTESGTPKAEPSYARYLGWPWFKLDQGPFTASFTSDGRATATEIVYSVSGFETSEGLRLTLDGAEIPHESPGHADRVFRTVLTNEGYSAGDHELTFAETNHDGNNWVSNLTIFEFGEGYHFAHDYIGAFPMYQAPGRQDGFRPTHDACLMRNMLSESFCPVCQENNWLQFFRKMKLVAGIDVSQAGDVTRLSARVPRLGQFRTSGTPPAGERLTVRWRHDGVAVATLDDQLDVELSAADARGRWQVDVTFTTPEVRKDSDRLLQGNASVVVP